MLAIPVTLVQGVIKLSEGQQSGVGGDGRTVEFQADFGVRTGVGGEPFRRPIGSQELTAILNLGRYAWVIIAVKTQMAIIRQ